MSDLRMSLLHLASRPAPFNQLPIGRARYSYLSNLGQSAETISWNSFKIGKLIRADAYTSEIARTFRSKGAQLLMSP